VACPFPHEELTERPKITTFISVNLGTAMQSHNSVRGGNGRYPRTRRVTVATHFPSVSGEIRAARADFFATLCRR
jgi:hypothetical protein